MLDGNRTDLGVWFLLPQIVLGFFSGCLYHVLKWGGSVSRLFFVTKIVPGCISRFCV